MNAEDYRSSVLQKWTAWLDSYSERLLVETEAHKDLNALNAERKQVLFFVCFARTAYASSVDLVQFMRGFATKL